MSCFDKKFSELSMFFLVKYPLEDDSTSRVFLLYVNKFSWKESDLEKIGYHNSRVS